MLRILVKPTNDHSTTSPPSTYLDEVCELFNPHLNRNSHYPPTQSVNSPLVEAILRDLNDVLLRILTSHGLAYSPYPTFDCLLAQTTGIFGTWDDLIKEFTNVLREATRKRRDNVIPAHWKLVEWVEQLAVMTDLTRGLALGENKQEEAYPTPSYLDFGQIAPHPHPDLD